MSQSHPPDPEVPFDIPIRTVPEWLTGPARAADDREPWYYGFLEKYARALLSASVLTFSLFSLLVMVPWLAPETGARIVHSVATPLISQAAGGPGAVRDMGLVAVTAARVVIGVALLGVASLAFLLPVLLTAAYILLSVDAGRNLRAIRRGGAGR